MSSLHGTPPFLITITCAVDFGLSYSVASFSQLSSFSLTPFLLTMPSSSFCLLLPFSLCTVVTPLSVLVHFFPSLCIAMTPLSVYHQFLSLSSSLSLLSQGDSSPNLNRLGYFHQGGYFQTKGTNITLFITLLQCYHYKYHYK